MIVIAIMATLLCIAVPFVSRAWRDGRIQQARADLQMISAAVTQLAWDTGEWPNGYGRNTSEGQNTEVWDLTTAAAGLTPRSSGTGFPKWQGPYIAKIALDPWGSPYFFDPDYSVGGSTLAVVGSFGPNKAGPNQYDSDDIYVVLK